MVSHWSILYCPGYKQHSAHDQRGTKRRIHPMFRRYILYTVKGMGGTAPVVRSISEGIFTGSHLMTPYIPANIELTSFDNSPKPCTRTSAASCVACPNPRCTCEEARHGHIEHLASAQVMSLDGHVIRSYCHLCPCCLVYS